MSAKPDPIPQEMLEKISAIAMEWAESCGEPSPQAWTVQSTDFLVMTQLRRENAEYASALAGHAEFSELVFFTVLKGDFAVPPGIGHRSASWVGLFIKDNPLRIRSFVVGDQSLNVSLEDLGTVYPLA